MPVNFAVKAGITVAMTAANMALSMSRKIEGPRLDNVKFTSGDYGATIPMVWGMRRVQGLVIWAEDLKEVKEENQTKGGKVTEYSYYGTWACAIAGHEISAIRRIWFDTKLVMDLSGAGPVSALSIARAFNRGIDAPYDFNELAAAFVLSKLGGKLGRIAVYYGTEDQLPDPRIQADIEAEFGEGSCPAYRGTPYIVFKNVPLEKFANRIPQVAVEVVSNPSTTYPFDQASSEVYGLDNFRVFSPDYSLLVLDSGPEFSVFDVAARQQIASGASPWNGSPILREDGNLLARSGNTLAQYDILGNFAGTFFDFGLSVGALLNVVYDGNGTEHRLVGPAAADGSSYFDETEASLGALMGETGSFYGMFVDLDGNVWGVAKQNASTTEAHFRRLVTIDSDLPDSFTASGLPSLAGVNDVGPGCHYRDATVDHFVFQWGNNLYAADPLTGAVTASQTAIEAATYLDAALINLPAGSASIWVGHEEFSLADLSKLREVDMADWSTDFDTSSSGIYDPINHALVSGNGADQAQAWLYLDRIGNGGITLGDIASDIAEQVGVEDHDFSDLTQVILGWSATQGQASNMLEPLFDSYDSDIRPHDFTLEGLKRHGVSGGTLLTERFVAADPRYTVKVRQGAEIPKAVVMNFADVNAEQQPNNARASRPLDATGAKGEQSIDLTTLALDPDEARGLTDRYFRRIWNERKEVSNALTAQHLALEPGDVRTLDLDGDEMPARLTRLTVQANGALAADWRYDHQSLALLDAAAGAPFDGRDEATVVVPLLSKGFVLDIPYIGDADAQTPPAVYVAAAPFAEGTWPGATIYREVDGDYTEEVASVSSGSPATWGYATDVLADANPNLWDRGNSVNVRLQTGTLTGTTEAAINTNPQTNLAMLGDEIVNFVTATLEGDGSYTLSGLKRGRRGTEWACGGHAAGEVFVLLSTAQDVALGLSEVGTEISFKAITAGRTTGFVTNLDPFTGASLKPYAPTHLEAVKESNGDWTLSWVRRTRVGGAWTSGTSIPLSEASEEYQITVGDGVSDDTKTVTSPTYTWDVATQTADTGAEVMAGDLEWTVAQISDAVGRGFEAIATA